MAHKRTNLGKLDKRIRPRVDCSGIGAIVAPVKNAAKSGFSPLQHPRMDTAIAVPSKGNAVTVGWKLTSGI